MKFVCSHVSGSVGTDDINGPTACWSFRTSARPDSQIRRRWSEAAAVLAIYSPTTDGEAPTDDVHAKEHEKVVYRDGDGCRMLAAFGGQIRRRV